MVHVEIDQRHSGHRRAVDTPRVRRADRRRREQAEARRLAADSAVRAGVVAGWAHGAEGVTCLTRVGADGPDGFDDGAGGTQSRVERVGRELGVRVHLTGRYASKSWVGRCVSK